MTNGGGHKPKREKKTPAKKTDKPKPASSLAGKMLTKNVEQRPN